MKKKRDTLSFKPAGEVANLVLDFGWSCGKADPGISIHFEHYKSGNYTANGRGGVLNKKEVKRVIKYLQKYVDKCDVPQEKAE